MIARAGKEIHSSQLAEQKVSGYELMFVAAIQNSGSIEQKVLIELRRADQLRTILHVERYGQILAIRK